MPQSLWTHTKTRCICFAAKAFSPSPSGPTPGIATDFYAYASLLNIKTLPEGKLIHAHIIQMGFTPKVSLGNKLVTVYAKCGNLADARRVLDEMPERDAISCTVMISAYSRRGYNEAALKLFYQMQRMSIQPDHFTFASVLPACASLATLEHGKRIHGAIIRSGFQSDVFVGSALVDMYFKCGRTEDARQVFDKMSNPNVVSWNTVIAGYLQNGNMDEALNLLRQMNGKSTRPDEFTFATVLPACAHLAVLRRGKEIHGNIVRGGFQSDVFVGSALVDMYAKSGSIENAHKVFGKMPRRDVFSWTAIIVGYATHGRGKEALQLFEQMQTLGTKPDHVTFIGVLSACCHAGLVDVGLQCFDRMCVEYHITPTMEHYCCIVDLLGRAGHLNEAQDFINKMPTKPDVAVWVSLLGACRIHTNIQIGERVAEHLFELDPQNAAHYVLLSNIYAEAGMWDDVEKVRKRMKDRRAKKTPGCSWIEINNKMNAFLVGDRSHPQFLEIYAKLERLSVQMEEAGYVPNMSFVLHAVEE